MAYMSQDRKTQLAPGIQKVLKEFGMKGTIGVNHHLTLVVNLSSGPLDLIGNYNQTNALRHPEFNPVTSGYMHVNEHWAHEHYTGQCKEFIDKLIAAMNKGNHDRSDAMTDHFDVGWYVSINIGKFVKPYQLIEGNKS